LDGSGRYFLRIIVPIFVHILDMMEKVMKIIKISTEDIVYFLIGVKGEDLDIYY